MDINSNDKENNEVNSSISSDLIRGHINTIILRTLYDGDKYGYEIINEIEEKSKGQYTLKQPTLYSALKRLETQDFVTSYWGGVSNGGRRKYFQLTEKGRTVAEQNLAEWEYSRTVIDSLISEREFDFNNPAPTAVDFNLLKKSTTRVRTGKEGEADEYGDYDDFEEYPDKGNITERGDDDDTLTKEESSTVFEPEIDDASSSCKQEENEQTEPESTTATAQNAAVYQDSATSQNPIEASEPDPVSVEEQRRIHENYKKLVGEDNDSTSYYYSNLNQQQHYEEKNQDTTQSAPTENEQASEQDSKYLENNAIASDILYSNKPPAERNYKQLLSKLYDNTQRPTQDNNIYEEQNDEPVLTQHYEQPSVQHTYETPPQSPVYNNANTASNIEFYDVQERAEYDGLKVNTANKSRSKPEIKSIGNTYDKGKVLFTTALYVFAIALIESIVFLCLKGVLKLGVAYVVLPFVFTFALLGVFMFLYLKGYGKNSRKSQAKSFISASLILFVNLVLVICLIAYLVMVYNEINVTFTEICKYAILPCIFVFNIPLFAIFYNYNRNKE